MRQFDRLTEMLANEIQNEPKAKKSRPIKKMTMMAIDNDTMLEVLKHLNYCQLATNSLVSKKFCDLIHTHRNSLALLYVARIEMNFYRISAVESKHRLKSSVKGLSTEAYDEWVILNNYSKQVPVEYQVASNQRSIYQLRACTNNKDLNHREWYDPARLFDVRAELNSENWPLFQHFIRLLTDPFVYLGCVELTPQNGVLNLLSVAIKPDHSLLQCKELTFDTRRSNQDCQSIAWTKNHVRCNTFCIYGDGGLDQNEALLDFVMNGASCTSKIKFYYFSRVMVDFIQKFLNLENRDEYHGVQSIEIFQCVYGQDIQTLKTDYAKYFVKEEIEEFEECGENHESTIFVFEFTNYAIGKKVLLTITTYNDYLPNRFSLKIRNV